MSGRLTAEQVRGWAAEVDAVGERIGRHFAGIEPRRAVEYIHGLLGGTKRKNGWQVAEHLGEATPDGVRHLLGRRRRPRRPARVRGRAPGRPRRCADHGRDGFPREGGQVVRGGPPVHRHGRAIENAQVGVLLGYATPEGRALVDRVLYLPREWAAGAERRKGAGVPGGVEFAAQIVLARRMIDWAVAAGVPAGWVTADAVYGSGYHFRATAEGHGSGYVVGGRADFAVWAGFRQVRVTALRPQVPADAWHRLSCGGVAKGPRMYDWTLRRTSSPGPDEYARWVLLRRGVSDPTEVAYVACGGPPDTTLWQLVPVAGTRWAVEDLFESSKGDGGLDEYELRSWTGWHRHVTPSPWALGVVAVIRSRLPLPRREKGARG